jgi:hypothetical protein
MQSENGSQQSARRVHGEPSGTHDAAQRRAPSSGAQMPLEHSSDRAHAAPLGAPLSGGGGAGCAWHRWKPPAGGFSMHPVPGPMAQH